MTPPGFFSIIAQIQTALEGKAGGSTKNTVTITVTSIGDGGMGNVPYYYNDSFGNAVSGAWDDETIATIEALGGYFQCQYIDGYTNAVSVYGNSAILALNDNATVTIISGNGGSN